MKGFERYIELELTGSAHLFDIRRRESWWQEIKGAEYLGKLRINDKTGA